jgi:periplasmic divalent cation tolerance protein
MKPSISFLYVTFPDEACAASIGKILLDEKRIACINILPVRSLYSWDGKTEDGKEIVAFIKTSSAKKEETVQRLKELHPYTTPCILQHTAETNDEHYDWVQRVTGL